LTITRVDFTATLVGFTVTLVGFTVTLVGFTVTLVGFTATRFKESLVAEILFTSGLVTMAFLLAPRLLIRDFLVIDIACS
jgi:hypothetical protein